MHVPARSLYAVYLLFFISGTSGLIYQVSWVRMFGDVFGNTVYSATLVTAVFMCGLGVGSYLAGVLADRRWRGRALRVYSWYEIAIALLGLLLAVLLPDLDVVSSAISSYVVDERGWHHLSLGSHLMRYGLAALLLLPSTILMGGTLTLLIRYCVAGDLSASGWRVGALYGVNTAGAALGCLLTDFLLVPTVGVLGTQALAVTANLIAGLGALRLAAAERAPAPSEPLPHPAPVSPAKRSNQLVLFTALALAISGAVGMGLEITWFRFLKTVLGSTRPIFSTMLAVILVGIWIGSIAGGALHRRFGRPVELLIAGQAALAVTAAAGLLVFERSLAFRLAEQPLLKQVVVAATVVGVPSLLMGLAYPLANASVQQTTAEIGRRAGALYLFNTLGAVLGATITGFFLLPAIGMQRSILVFMIASIAAVLLLDRTHAQGGLGLRWRGSWAAVASLGATCAVLLSLPPDYLLERIFPADKRADVETLALSESITGTIKIQDYAGRHRTLHTDGHPMSGNRWDSQRYMRMFVHAPLLHLDAPKSVLVICFGVGTTLHAASTHPTVERLEVADLSEDILEHAGYFEETNRNVLKDPRVKVFVNDGRQHLRMTDQTYDLVTLEPPPIDQAGVAALYSEEFYELVRNRLRPGGFITQWVPAYQVPGEVDAAIVKAFINVFPESILLSGYSNELILMGRKDARILIDPGELEARLSRAPSVREDLERVYLGSITQIIGAFAGSREQLRKATINAPPVTDDFPILEYASVAYEMSPIPSDFFDVGRARRWCPACFQRNKRPAEGLEDLGVYLFIMSRIYASDDFLAFGVPGPKRPLILPDDVRVKETIESQPFLKKYLSRPR